MLIDTHAHVNFAVFKADADVVIKKALAKNIWLINVGSQYSTSVRAVAYAEKYEQGIFAAIGLHPVQLKKGSFMHHDSDELEESEIKTIGEEFEYGKYLELAKHPKVVAIGEVGLDYHHFEEGDDVEKLKIKQKEILFKFIEMANEVQKPLMIHCWDGMDDLLEILQNNLVAKRGVIHSFSGSYKTAQKFIELGYKIGLNGVITYGISYNKLIRETDLKDIVLETDCPYLTPVPHKGERNEPVYVELVAQKIAEIKNISVEEVAEVTTNNAKKLFGL